MPPFVRKLDGDRVMSVPAGARPLTKASFYGTGARPDGQLGEAVSSVHLKSEGPFRPHRLPFHPASGTIGDDQLAAWETRRLRR